MDPAEYSAMHAQELRHWWFRGRRRVLEDLVRSTRPRPGAAILDYGAGTGGNRAMLEQFGTVVGMEPDAGALTLARTREGGRYVRGGGTALPFDHASFDLVLAADVLEHIADDRVALAEIRRVLRPGGALVFSVPAHQWLWSRHDTAVHHERRYDRRDVRDLLAPSGLELTRLSFWNAALFPAIAAYRLLDRRFRPDATGSDIGATPAAANALLGGIMRLEAAALRWMNLPWGLSLVGVARRSQGGGGAG